jgi:hypothetical protein
MSRATLPIALRHSLFVIGAIELERMLSSDEMTLCATATEADKMPVWNCTW